jgi:hypothetical protein
VSFKFPAYHSFADLDSLVYNVGQLYAANMPKVKTALRSSRVREARDNFNTTFKRIGQRLRSMSPSKGARKPLTH